MDLDEGELEQLEQWLMMSQSGNNEAIHAATPHILGVIDMNTGPDYFRAIMEKSGEPIARAAAAVFFYDTLKVHLNSMNARRLERFGTFLLKQICAPNQHPTILKNCMDCVVLIVSRKHLVWKGLLEVLDSLKDALSSAKLELLADLIAFLPEDYLKERYQLFGAVAVAALAEKDWDVIGCGITAIALLIKASESAAGFEPVFETLIGFCGVIFQQSSDAQKFFDGLSMIFATKIFDRRLPVAVMTALSQQEVDVEAAEQALNALEDAVEVMDQDQVLVYVRLAVHFLEKDIGQNEALPARPLDHLITVFRYMKHEVVYDLLLQMAREYAKSNMCMALLMFGPVFEGAKEQIGGDIEFIVELLKAGLTGGNALACQAACFLLHLSDDVADVQAYVSELIPLVVRLLTVPNEEVRHWAFLAAQSMVAREQVIQGLLDIVWAVKDQVQPKNLEDWLILLASAVRNSEVSDAQLREICGLILPIIGNIDATLEATAGLWVLCQLIQHDEGTMFGLVQQTVPAIRAGCTFKNQESRVRTLGYLSEVVESYGEEALPIVHQVSNEIGALLKQDKLSERVLTILLNTSCHIAQAGEKAIVPDVMARIQKCLEREAQASIAVRSLKSLVRTLPPEQVAETFGTVVGICKETTDEETCQNSLRTLAKCIKVSNESMLASMLPAAAEIGQMFVTGALPCLDGKPLMDPRVDVDMELLDSFLALASAIVAYKSTFVEPLCLEMLKLLDRKESAYKNAALDVVIDAIQKETLSESVTARVIGILPQLMTDAKASIQQNLIFILIVILQRHPDFIGQVQQITPILMEWWRKAQENKEGYAMIIANLASLYLLIESRSRGTVGEDLLLQILEAFPPADVTETAPMCSNLLVVVSQAGASLSLPVRISTAIGIGRLLTKSKKKLAKLDLDPTIVANLGGLLKTLCQTDQSVAQAVSARFQASSSKMAKISAILGS